MHMIGQHDNGVDPEREFLLRPDDRVAQGTDMFDQQSFSPLQHIYGEEPAAAWNECTTIIGHETRISHHHSVLANPPLSESWLARDEGFQALTPPELVPQMHAP